MKKLLKKMKPFLKRSTALIGVVMVLVCSLVVPSFAIDFSTSFTGEVMQPLFNYDYLVIYYSGGQRVTFSLKDVFFGVPFSDSTITYTLTDLSGERSITVTLSDADFDQIRYNSGSGYVSMPYWRLSFDISAELVENISIGCSEAIYNYELLSTVYNIYKDDLRFLDANYRDLSYSYSNDAVFYYPLYSYGDGGSVVGRQLASYDLSFSSSNASGFPISPNANISKLVDFLPGDIYRKYLYFSDFVTTFSPNSADGDTIRFNIFYIPESHVISFKDYYDTYFPAYRTDNVAVDFTGWLSTAVGGFLSFEFIPGISLGTLLLFMLGVGAFNVFLKFFAGG